MEKEIVLEKSLLMDDDIYAYLIGDSKTMQILEVNKLAQSYFYVEQNFPQLNDVFMHTEILVDAIEMLTEKNSVTLEDVHFLTNIGKEILCDVEICLVDPETHRLFLTVKEKELERNTSLNDLVELDANPILVMRLDENYTVDYGNEQFFQCIQIGEEEFATERQSSFLAFMDWNKREGFKKAVSQRLQQGLECDIDVELTFDGQYYHLFRLNAHRSAVDGRLYGVLISIKTQSELMKKIEYDQQYFDIMQRFSKDLLFRIDIKKRTLVHRGDISKFLDLQPVVENFPESIRETIWVHPDDLEGYIAFCYRLIHGMDSSYESRFQFQNGNFEKYRLQGSVLFDEAGVPVQVVGKAENIQKYVEIEAKANYDSLTSALNKGSFTELVTNLLERALERDRYALLFLDFDDFKGVNDRMGHVFGDFLLEATTKRILNCVRNHDKVGRVGGDEFVIFFQHAPSAEAVLERAEAILTSLRREFSNGDLHYKIKASIGISLYPEHGATYEELYHRADLALYRSKELGKDVATIYGPDMEK